MRRLAAIAVALVLTVSRPAGGQDSDSSYVERGPRFLLASGTRAPPVRVDLTKTPMLRRRISVNLTAMTLGQALQEVSERSGVRLAFSNAVLPPDRRVELRADNITVAAALTELLIDTQVDILFSRDGGAVLIRRTAGGLQGGTLSGQVTDAKTGQGLVGAEVLLEGTKWRMWTGEDGRYRLVEVGPGTYTLAVRRIGFGRQSRAVTVESDQEVVVDVALEPVPTKLEEVVVTGTVVPTEVKALPTPVDIVTADDIERQQIRRTDQIFRIFVPSALAWDLGESPEQTAITIRGSSSFGGGTGVKIFVDGIEVASTTFTLIDPKSIERVEIIRGPQAATIYGPGAIGGVMQVFTKKGNSALRSPAFEAQASAGVLESEFKDGGTLRQEYRSSITGGGGGFGYNLGGSYIHTGEWIPEFRLRAPSVYGGARLTQGPFTLELTSRYAVTNQNIPNSPRLVQAGLESPLPRYEERHYRQSTYGAHVSYIPFPWWRHNLTVGIDGFAGSQYNTRPRLLSPADTFLSVVERESNKKSVAYNSSVTLPVAAALSATVTAGVDHFTTDEATFVASLARNFEGVINPDPAVPITAIRGPTRNTGYFAQTQLGFRDAVFLTAGVRVDQNTVLGDEDPVSPRVGITYTRPLAGASVKLRAAYGEAIRAPEALARLGLDIGVLRFLPNLDLRAEQQKGVDAGVDLAWSGGSVGVTYYRQTARDLIIQSFVGVDEAGVTLLQDQNAGRVRNTGLELQGALQVGSAQLTAKYAYTSSKVLELAPGYLGELLPGDYVLEIPKHTAGATVDLAPLRNTTISSGVTYVGKRTSYDHVALISGTPAREAWITYDPFLKLNLALTQTLTPSVAAIFSVENLSNNNTGEQFDYLPSVGRVTTVGLRARW